MRESGSFRIAMRAKLYKSQNGVCAYCKRLIKGKPSLDHIIPLNAMEVNEYNQENYVVTCIACNKRKGDRIVFSNLLDREIYPIIDVPYFFRLNDIQYNFKDKK
jgi:CRISPR/Cas system Type II protein with McrA/HNH and RuvC-like nuclease domain